MSDISEPIEMGARCSAELEVVLAVECRDGDLRCGKRCACQSTNCGPHADTCSVYHHNGLPLASRARSIRAVTFTRLWVEL